MKRNIITLSKRKVDRNNAATGSTNRRGNSRNSSAPRKNNRSRSQVGTRKNHIRITKSKPPIRNNRRFNTQGHGHKIDIKKRRNHLPERRTSISNIKARARIPKAKN